MKKSENPSLSVIQGSDYTHPDFVTLNNRLADELAVVENMIEREGRMARDESAALRKDITRLKVMVNVLAEALAARGQIDMAWAAARMEEQMREFEPDPPSPEPEPVVEQEGSPYRGNVVPIAAPVIVSADPFEPIVPPQSKR